MRPLKFSQAAVFAACLALSTPTPALFGVGDIVFDPASHAEAVLTNLRMAESLANEARMIQNQLNQYQNMLEQAQRISSGEWSQINGLLSRLASTMEQGDSIAYSMSEADQLFRTTFPGYQPPKAWSDDYESWTKASLDTLRGVLRGLGIHGQEYGYEQARIRAIQALSDNAVGRMQVLQAANMLASEEVQSLGKLRQLMAMQVNQQSVYYAHQVNKEAASRALAERFLTSPNRKPPTPYGEGQGAVSPKDFLNLVK